MLTENTNNKILGLKIFLPVKYSDNRGCFFESFNQKEMNNKRFVQDNHSVSKKGVIRGLHMQIKPYEQGKLIRVVKGKILDVVVDMRPKSKTYLKNFSIELNSDNLKILFVPPGCLHGFLSLEDDTIVNYKVTKYWNKESEQGIKWNDPKLAIDWKLKENNIDKPIVSDKDNALPYLNN